LERTIHSRLRASSSHAGARPALLGLGRGSLSHQELCEQIERTVGRLHECGLGRGDRVAIALPNSPDAAACCMAVASTASAAPLNPASQPQQFQSYFAAMRARALIVEEHSDCPAVRVAQEMGIQIIWLRAERGAPAGVFHLDFVTRNQPRDTGWAEEQDVALLMHTSGSTSGPKLAPLTHLNISAGSGNNASHLQLTAQDRCLCVTSMFFTQGILVSVISALFEGGSTVVTPGYDPIRFFAWLDEFRPTWYAAPVAIQRNILSRAHLWPEIVERSRLRVIRCSSSIAEPALIAGVEKLFRAPMLDAYGLTETSSTVVGEPMPPARRKPGSVGVATGCEVAIAGEKGAFLPAGQIGEVLLRGPSVIGAYEAEPGVNESAFSNGWLRTGDLGKIDPDGFLFLTGREKELINRGGEKISPAEIDEVLLSHGSVSQAMAFSLPDERLGEDVGALVVLRDRAEDAEKLAAKLRQLVRKRLANSKAPSRIWFVDDLPRTATGKPQRIGVAQKLGLSTTSAGSPNGVSVAAFIKPVGDVIETTLTHIWEDALRRRPIGLNQDFFELGGDSLLAAGVAARIEKVFGHTIGLPRFMEAPTVARMADLLRRVQARLTPSQVIPIQSSGSRAPLHLMGLYPLFRALLLRLADDQPIFGVSYADLSTMQVPFRMEDFAAHQIETLRRTQPRGPYVLGGWCKDGVLAYEIARQLTAAGENVPLVILIDCFNPAVLKNSLLRPYRIEFHLAKLAHIELTAIPRYCMDRVRTLAGRLKTAMWRSAYHLRLRVDRRVNHEFRNLTEVFSLAAAQYQPQSYSGRVLLVRPQERPAGDRSDAAIGWRELVPNLKVVDAIGNHVDMFREPQVDSMASILEAELLRANGRESWETNPPGVARMSAY
jgi:oxalate---CoA ligase